MIFDLTAQYASTIAPVLQSTTNPKEVLSDRDIKVVQRALEQFVNYLVEAGEMTAGQSQAITNMHFSEDLSRVILTDGKAVILSVSLELLRLKISGGSLTTI